MTRYFQCVVASCLSSLVVTTLWAQPTFRDATDLLNQPALPPDAVSGASIIDVNQDGQPDLFRPGTLYFNQGSGFLSNLGGTGIAAQPAAAHGVTWADANADGLIDALVIGVGGSNASLYLNLGNGRFERADGFNGSGFGGIWGDFDNDGRIDVLMSANGQATVHINQGNAQFQARTVATPAVLPPFTCGGAAADYDRDGDLDVFLAGCDLRLDRFPPPPRMQNALLRNNGDGTFSEVARDVGLFNDIDALNQNETKSMVWFDYNNDGWLDLYEISDRIGGGFFGIGVNRLFRNDQDGTFTDVTAETGVAGNARDRSGAVVAGDFDNDGLQDLYVGLLESRPDNFYRNMGNNTFSLVEVGIPVHNPTALSTGDVNADGWLDLFSGFSLGDRLWLNEGGSNHWLTVKARSISENRFGIGARIEVVTGEQRYTRIIHSGEGGASQAHNLTAHFGVGSATLVDSVIVYWPSGVVDRLHNVAVDQELTIAEGIGVNTPPEVSLATPRDNSRIDLQEGGVTFAWRSTDVDGDNLSYNLYLRGVGIDSTFRNLNDTELTVSTSVLRRNEDYFWNVTATDGVSVRRSSVQRITFGEPPVPDLQLVSFPLAEVYAGTLDLGDFDGDSDPDLVMTGRTRGGTVTSVFRLDDVIIEQVVEQDTFFIATKQYRSVPTALPGTENGGATWADVDSDGDLDLVLHGVSSDGVGRGPRTRLFVNNNGIFFEQNGTPFPGIVHSDIAWGDYNGDGQVDALLTGATSATAPYEPITQLYQNNNGSFVEVPLDIPGFFLSHAAWGDYDDDGDQDFAIMGAVAQGVFETHLYRNEGGNRFAKSNVVLEGLGWGSVEWGDYDADGDLDLLVAGSQLGPSLLRGRTQIYRNDGSGQFIPLTTELPQGVLGTARWGDYDLDGDLDLVAVGSTQPLSPPETVLYRNNEGRFLLDLSLVGFLYSDLLFTDYNDDGDADVILVGRDFEENPALRFFINCLVPEFLPESLVGENGGC